MCEYVVFPTLFVEDPVFSSVFFFLLAPFLKIRWLWGEGRIKENGGGGEFKYNIFVRTFINATMYPSSKTKLCDVQ
jgi:hypothetical protein